MGKYFSSQSANSYTLTSLMTKIKCINTNVQNLFLQKLIQLNDLNIYQFDVRVFLEFVNTFYSTLCSFIHNCFLKIFLKQLVLSL